MTELVTLEDVKRNLRLTSDHEDADLMMKLELATEIIVEFAKQRLSGQEDWEAEVDAWTEETVPARIAAAILRQVTAMYRFRGDDPAGVDPGWEDGLAPGVKGLLVTMRDPMLA